MRNKILIGLIIFHLTVGGGFAIYFYTIFQIGKSLGTKPIPPVTLKTNDTNFKILGIEKSLDIDTMVTYEYNNVLKFSIHFKGEYHRCIEDIYMKDSTHNDFRMIFTDEFTAEELENMSQIISSTVLDSRVIK